MQKQQIQKKAIGRSTSSSEIPTRPFAAPKPASSEVRGYNLLDKPLFPIQTKLTNTSPNDQYEQEADPLRVSRRDRVATEVVRQIHPCPSSLPVDRIVQHPKIGENPAVVKGKVNQDTTILLQRKKGFNIATQETTIHKKQGNTFQETEETLDVGEGCQVIQEKTENDISWSCIQVGTISGWVKSASLISQPKPDNNEVDYAKVEGQLFDQFSLPKIEDVKQGNLSNCYLMAPIAAVADTPKGKILLKGVIEPKEANTKFSVHLFNFNDSDELEAGDPIKIDNWFPISDEKFIYCPGKIPITPAPPLWAAVLEKAWAEDEEQDCKKVGYRGLKYHDAATAMSQLTGRTTFKLCWNKDAEALIEETAETESLWQDAYENDEEDEPENLANIKNISDDKLLLELASAKGSSNQAVIAETRKVTGEDINYLDEGLKILESHVYVVKLVNVEAKQITLWNPNQNHPPRPLTIAEFKNYFDRVLKCDLSDVPDN